MSDIISISDEYIAPTYARFPLALKRGQGSLVYDADGNEYIDLGSGIAVTSFGISDKEWAQAVSGQLTKLQHTSNLYYTSPCAELARTLCERTGMKKVFFSNSGAEANECAIKAARKYAAERHGDDCFTVVTLNQSFHGRTITTLAATGQDHFHELFQPLTAGFVHTPANDIKALEKLLDSEKIAAVMIECVQGEGGVLPLDKEFVSAVRELTAARDIVMIVDEVQTGNGRCGELYAYMNFGIMPDIVTTAKGLGGGLPIGATMLCDKLQSVFGYGDHGSTFGGNPVCCAGALNILSRVDDKLLSDVREKSEYVFNSLKNVKGVKSVSGMGLMIGIETEKPAAEIVKECMKRGVLCLTAKSKVRLLPALNIPFDLLEKSVKILIGVIEE